MHIAEFLTTVCSNDAALNKLPSVDVNFTFKTRAGWKFIAFKTF